MIDYKNFKRKDWNNLYKTLTEDKGYQIANEDIISLWNNPNNKYKSNFAVPQLLLLSIATYRQRNSINNVPFVITADSVPVYATWQNWWDDVYHWELPQWEIWFDKLIDKYGLESGQQKFHNAWSFADNWSQGVWSSGVGWEGCYDCDFVNFCRTRGIDVACWGLDNTCTLVSVGTNLIDATQNVSQGVENISEAGLTITQMLPFFAIAVAGLFTYIQIKKYEK